MLRTSLFIAAAVADRFQRSLADRVAALSTHVTRAAMPSRVGVWFAVLVALGAPTVQAATFSWTDDNDGWWSHSGNWSPSGPPGLGDIARLGNLAGVSNTAAVLDMNDAVAELHITDGMTLATNTHTFSVIGDTYISGLNIAPHEGGGGFTYHHSRIYLENTPAPVEFTTDDLTVTNQGRIWLAGGGLEVRNELYLDSVSSMTGIGSVRLINSGLVLSNSGEINPTGHMAMHVTNGGELDFDGFGSGTIQLDWAGDHLTVNGGVLADPFSNEILIDGGASLQMNLDAAWSTDAGSSVLFGRNNNGVSAEAAILGGAEVTLGGLVETPWGTEGHINAPANFVASSFVLARENSQLDLNNDTRIESGGFLIEENANLRFDGATEVQGGTFTTHSQLSADGAVRFNGATSWDGDVVINGIALQNGDAEVDGSTTIQAGVFDMDGGGGTAWDINASLSVTADSIDSTLSNTFDGTLNINGGIYGNLAVNLTGSFDEWVMNGEMNLVNGLPFSTSRVNGSRMRVTGDLNVTGPVRINADLELASNATTTLQNDTATLYVSGDTLVEAGATFMGTGQLRNLPSGHLMLADGVDTDDVSVVNQGLFEVGSSPGTASVESFTNGSNGAWLVELGGYLAGTEHDLLQVTGGATVLDGLIEVELIDLGLGVFAPAVGDEFTVLTSLDTISGTFLNNPVTFADSLIYHWTVVYEPHEVTLVLADIIVPEPSTSLMLLMPLLFTGLRRGR